MTVRGTTLCLLCLAVPLVAEPVRVMMLDGRSIEGTSLTLTDKTLVLGLADDAEQSMSRDRVASIRLKQVRSVLPPGKPMLLTRGGGRLLAEGLRLKGSELHFGSLLLGKDGQLPIGSCSAMLLPEPGKTAGWVLDECRRRNYQSAGEDLLVVVRKDGQWQSIAGTLVGLDGKKLTFRFRGEDRTLDRSRVRAVLLAGADATKQTSPAGVVVGVSGERVAFAKLTARDGEVRLAGPAVGERSLPTDRLAEIRFRSDRRVPLGELTPVEVREAGLFATYPHRLGRSAAGGPIRLGGQTYETGLGLHSRAELVYDLGGAYESFLALAGIDDAVRPQGRVTLTVLADGKELFGPAEMTGRDDPRPIRVDVRGVDRMTILVDFGADGLDVGDHLDLAEAVLIRAEDSKP